MYKKLSLFSLSTAIMVSFTACSNPKVKDFTNDIKKMTKKVGHKINDVFESNEVWIHTVKPSSIPIRSKEKVVTVDQFENDKFQLANKIISDLNIATVKGNKYFTVLNQFETDKILKKIGFVDTGLINKEESLKIKKETGANLFILGVVSPLKKSYRYFEEKRNECDNSDNKRCWHTKVECKTTNFDLNAYIRIVDLKTSEILYSEGIDKVKSYKFCEDDLYKIPSDETVGQFLAADISKELVRQMTPQPYSFKVTLLTSDDYYEFNDKQESQIRLAIANIKRGRYKRASEVLEELIKTTEGQSYVPLYNLGVMKEALGEYEEALKLYYRAEKLSPEPIEEIIDAIVRVKKLQQDQYILNVETESKKIQKTKEEIKRLKKEIEEMKKFEEEARRLAEIKLIIEKRLQLRKQQEKLKKEIEKKNKEQEKRLQEEMKKLQEEQKKLEELEKKKKESMNNNKKLELLKKEQQRIRKERERRKAEEEAKRKAEELRIKKMEKELLEQESKLLEQELKEKKIKKLEKNKKETVSKSKPEDKKETVVKKEEVKNIPKKNVEKKIEVKKSKIKTDLNNTKDIGKEKTSEELELEKLRKEIESI